MSAHLSAIAVQNYRCFPDFELALRPLTLVYGWNGAGKSALVRLLGLIGDAVRPKAPPVFDLGRKVARDVPFAEMEWKGKSSSEASGFQLLLRWSDGFEVSWLLDRHLRTGRPMVATLSIQVSGEQRVLEALPMEGQFQLRGDPASPPVRVSFSGLIPRTDAPGFDALTRRLEALDGRVSWLGNARSAVPRRFERDRVATELGEAGEEAIPLLLNDRELQRVVGDWFSRPPMSRILQIREDGSQGKLLLQPKGPAFDIDFVDAGSGFSHILPLLVGVAQAERSSSMIAAEEPESHLHTNAQRALAEWLCERIVGENPPTIVLETHSSVLVAAVQLAIARTPKLAERVGVYWLEQREDGASGGPLVTFDDQGRPKGGGWPRDAFADERALGRELANLRFGSANRP